MVNLPEGYPPGALSLVAHMPLPIQVDGACAGLLVDEWLEMARRRRDRRGLRSSTRRRHIDAGLAAGVHDPLWMLARQWQTGEFQGEDGGTPAQVQARIRRSPLARYHAGPVAAGTPMTSRPYRGAIPRWTGRSRRNHDSPSPVDVSGTPAAPRGGCQTH
jgi:hypothetical protein